MRTFQNHSKVRPEPVKVMHSCVDVNTDVREVEIPHKKNKNFISSETMFEYTTTRYSYKEYMVKLSQDSATMEKAFVELVNA